MDDNNYNSHITSNKKAAIALKYNPEINWAPVVVASGLGEIAKKIVNIADEHGVPIYRDDSVASMLVMLSSGAAVPPELYSIVAAIYSEVVYAANDISKKTESALRKS